MARGEKGISIPITKYNLTTAKDGLESVISGNCVAVNNRGELQFLTNVSWVSKVKKTSEHRSPTPPPHYIYAFGMGGRKSGDTIRVKRK